VCAALVSLLLAVAMPGSDRCAAGQAVGAVDDCGFSKYPRVVNREFAKRATVRKAVPERPAEARALAVEIDVSIEVLVDRRGTVVKTCILRPPEGPAPVPSLVSAAEAAARRWLFQPNFGLPKGVRPKNVEYVRDTLTFRFGPKRPKRQR
jgi:hypothetical protein